MLSPTQRVATRHLHGVIIIVSFRKRVVCLLSKNPCANVCFYRCTHQRVRSRCAMRRTGAVYRSIFSA
jgi:hypothetical protein